jgi:predicted ATP-dependent serine protease
VIVASGGGVSAFAAKNATSMEGKRRGEGRVEALRGHRLTPLVGREHELGLLLDRFERAQEGEGQVVLLGGEPGIGKSRIVHTLRGCLAIRSTRR